MELAAKKIRNRLNVSAEGAAELEAPHRIAVGDLTLALDQCAQTLKWRHWERLRYWHAIHLREKRRLAHETRR